jgi:hypothetical protein
MHGFGPVVRELDEFNLLAPLCDKVTGARPDTIYGGSE